MTTLAAWADTDAGFSIIDIPQSLRTLTESIITATLQPLASRPELEFDSLLADVVNGPHFEQIKAKAFRMFDAEAVSQWIRHDFCQRMMAEDRSLFISDEENLGHPNIYWRLVRAGSASDVGPVHADHWFWDLGHGTIPPGHRRVKMWLPLRQDPTHVGLSIGPGTHRMTFAFEKVFKDGKFKPVFERGPVEHLLVPAPVRVGQAIIFHDRLLHAGEVSPTQLRLSMELTWVMRDSSPLERSPPGL